MFRKATAGMLVLVLGLAAACDGDDDEPSPAASSDEVGEPVDGPETVRDSGDRHDPRDDENRVGNGNGSGDQTVPEPSTGAAAPDEATGERETGDDAGLEDELVYSRSGGIAGEISELTVRPDGTAEVRGPRPSSEPVALTLTESEMQAVEAAVAATDFTNPPPAPPVGQCCDQFTYVVSYDGHEARTDTFSSTLPPGYSELFSELDAILDRGLEESDPSDPDPQPEPGPALDGELVYTRAGGIDGAVWKLVVQPDGSAEVSGPRPSSDGRTTSLTDDELAALAAAAEAAELGSLRPSPRLPGGNQCYDCFVYTVSYDGATVRSDSFVDEPMPPELLALFDELSTILDRVKAS